MAERNLVLDTAHLLAGADRCNDAAEAASAAAVTLAAKKPSEGIFGDFAQARAFHSALSAAHDHHVAQLREHHRSLTDMGAKSQSAAVKFVAEDDAAAASVRAAGAVIDPL